MSRNFLAKTGFLALMGAIATSSFLLTSAQNQAQAPSPTATDAGSQSQWNSGINQRMELGPADAEFDLRFIDAMTPHQGAVEMAKEAQQKSKRPEIQKLAADIIQAQDKEINQRSMAASLVSHSQCRASRLQLTNGSFHAHVSRPNERYDDEHEFRRNR